MPPITSIVAPKGPISRASAGAAGGGLSMVRRTLQRMGSGLESDASRPGRPRAGQRKMRRRTRRRGRSMSTRRAFLGLRRGRRAVRGVPRRRARRGCSRPAAARPGAAPETVAADEDYWREIQQAFTVDRSYVNLNNGGVCPSPRIVQEAMKRYLDLSNEAPVYTMWQLLEPQIESVRRGLAREFGCDPEEMAITRNASEALESVQLGLDLKPGDEVLTTTPGLSAHAHHLAPARAARRHRAEDDLLPGAAAEPGRPRPSASSGRSRRAPRSSSSATSPTSPARSSR